MLYGSGLVLKRLALPGLALLVGAQLSASMTLLEDHSCRRFEGRSSGNDPDSVATLDLCREGDRLWGLMRSEGRSGTSVGELVGHVEAGGRMRLVDIGAVVDEPNPGWVFCFDDVVDLTWDPISRRVSGTYASEDCDDKGALSLRAR